jgi:N-acetylmuramic acid 6-phosphate etherase
MHFEKITEQPSLYRHIEKMSVATILQSMNEEDKKIPIAVEKVLPNIEKLIAAIVEKLLAGGRLFYLGAGTSGRLGILDASEIPPTYGLPYGVVIGLIAGGEKAIQKAIENAEDNSMAGWNDLQQYNVDTKDVVVGIASSGTTPYVMGALQQCQQRGIVTGSISCNPASPISQLANYPIEVIVGPEFITGSTRMKSGTAQKLILNMISTTVMIQIGRVEDNKMVNMQLNNQKLIDRGTHMVMEQLGLTTYNQAKDLLLKYGSVKKAVAQGKVE